MENKEVITGKDERAVTRILVQAAPQRAALAPPTLFYSRRVAWVS